MLFLDRWNKGKERVWVWGPGDPEEEITDGGGRRGIRKNREIDERKVLNRGRRRREK